MAVIAIPSPASSLSLANDASKAGISPRTVMALGRWSSYDTIEPDLAAPTEATSIESMSAGALGAL